MKRLSTPECPTIFHRVLSALTDDWARANDIAEWTGLSQTQVTNAMFRAYQEVPHLFERRKIRISGASVMEFKKAEEVPEFTPEHPTRWWVPQIDINTITQRRLREYGHESRHQ